MESTTDLFVERYGVPRYAGQRMAKADFLLWQSDDNYVYEFNNGLLEPTTSLRQDENYLLTNLEDYFGRVNSLRHQGRLRIEMDVWLSEKQMRRPDVAYCANEQIRRMNAGEKVVPEFMVELASGTDNKLKSLTKRHEYFAAGV